MARKRGSQLAKRGSGSKARRIASPQEENDVWMSQLCQISDNILFCIFFSMAAVDSTNPVMPEPEWAKPRDKNAPPPV